MGKTIGLVIPILTFLLQSHFYVSLAIFNVIWPNFSDSILRSRYWTRISVHSCNSWWFFFIISQAA